MNDEESGDESNLDEALDEAFEERGNPLIAELERPNIHREQALRFLDFMFDSLCMIKGYQGNKEFALDCYLAALGGRGWSIIGDDIGDQTQLAGKWGCTKANVSKLVKKFQSPGFLNIPPAPGQRRLEGCETMRKKRKEQLTHE